jgi:hypothetical protein
VNLPEFKLGKLVKERTAPDKVTFSSRDYKLKLKGNCFVYGRLGKGKTILVKVLIEEAIMKGFPCLVIDPKGDLAQLAWTSDISWAFVDKEEILYQKSCLDRFRISHLAEDYKKKVGVRLFDHNSELTPDMLQGILDTQGHGRTPLNIVSLHFAQNNEQMNTAVKQILDSLKMLKAQNVPRFLFMDEAHRFSKSVCPNVFASLDTMVRETSRIANFKVILSTQSEEDFGRDFIHGGEFRHFFHFQKEQYKCKILLWDEEDTQPHRDASDYLLLPRYVLTGNRKLPITREEFDKTMRYWEIVTNPLTSILECPLKTDLLVAQLDETDFKILSCLNDAVLEIEWNPSAIQKSLGYTIGESKEILSSLNSSIVRRIGRYRTWLDYAKIGYPITAFFVTKGREDWESKIPEIKAATEAVEFFEIKAGTPPEYLDVNLLGKFRFRNMRHYFDFVSKELLKISKRGMSTKERFEKYIDDYRVGSKSDPKYRPPIPPEQLVSGCISNRAFVEHPGCYIQEDASPQLSKAEIKVLRHLIELKDKDMFLRSSQCGHVLDFNSLAEKILNTKMCANLTKKEVMKRIGKMVEFDIIKGAYFELPWDILGYKSAFVLGQFDFDKDIEEQVYPIVLQHEVQEVHTIVGTYDVLVKVRCPKERGSAGLSEIMRQLPLLNMILLDVRRELKAGYRMQRLP